MTEVGVYNSLKEYSCPWYISKQNFVISYENIGIKLLENIRPGEHLRLRIIMIEIKNLRNEKLKKSEIKI